MADIREGLKGIRGTVHTGGDILRYYSVDSSAYQITPDAVVAPADCQDVAAVVGYAARTGTPVTVRGAGTGLVGSALNRGIILDMRHLDRIEADGSTVVVGAGVQKGRLDLELGRRGKTIGVNPSVGPYCAVGGMIGTNASGSRSLRYGSMIDNILEVTMVDGTGRIIKLPADPVASRIAGIAGRADTSAYPDVSKNSSGYRLDRVGAVSDAARILAGAEGTLGIVVEARLKIHDIPKDRTLYVVGYRTGRQAMEDVDGILETNPLALEFVDSHIISFMPERPGDAQGLLLVEYSGAHTFGTAGTIHARLTEPAGISRWWRYRDSALVYSTRELGDGSLAPHIIEDAAVPAGRILDLWDIAAGISKRYKIPMIIYGHAGNCNLHIRAAIPDMERLHDIASDFFDRVIGIGGTISGEHGDGIARTEFVSRQYGKHNYGLFGELKKLLDPHGILNPGKIVSA